MGKGFFRKSQVQTKRRNKTTRSSLCAKCELHKNCVSPKIPPSGDGNIRILHVTKSPGAREDARNQHLVGQHGQFYRRILKKFGHDIEDSIMTSAIICRPEKNKKPTKIQVDCCRPNLEKTIKKYKPHLIITLGDFATKAVLQPDFKKDIGKVSKWRGSIIPHREYNAWVCPTLSLDYVQRESTSEVAELIFKQDIEHALSMMKYQLPDYKKETDCVEIIKHPDSATNWLRDLFRSRKMFAFDFESTGLKPQWSKQQIKTIAFSTGVDHAVAFKLFENDFDFIEILKHVLEFNKLKKICANIKFERDWTNVKLKGRLNGLFFDTMVGAHYIDNRPRTTALDFQLYSRFGIPSYDEHIKPFLKSDGSLGGNTLNNIHKIDLRDLLEYNGVDALGEFKLGLLLMDILQIDYTPYYEGPFGFDLLPHYYELYNREELKHERQRTDSPSKRRRRTPKKVKRTRRKRNIR